MTIPDTVQKPNSGIHSLAGGDGPNWINHAFAVYHAAKQEEDDALKEAQAAEADRVIQALAENDPPILGAEPLGNRAIAAGIVFGFHSEYGAAGEELSIFQECTRCGTLIASRPLRTWEDIGFCLAISPAHEVAARQNGDSLLDSAWHFHSCPEPDPADLVSIVRHLLLFAYDPLTSEPVLPIYAIRRAENALTAFENKGSEKGGD